MKKSTGCILALLHLLMGISIGFFASMVKNGFSAGNNSGNTNHNYYYGTPPAAANACDPDEIEG